MQAIIRLTPPPSPQEPHEPSANRASCSAPGPESLALKINILLLINNYLMRINKYMETHSVRQRVKLYVCTIQYNTE